MSQSKLVTDEEYRFILDKVNRVICQFSSSADKTSEAIVFLSRIEEKCTSKAEFLHLIEQRLQVLTNTDKSQEYIEWFKVRRTSLASFLQGIKDKLRQDVNYLSKYSPAFTKGVQCLDRLLKLDVEAIGHNHMVDLSRVRKAVLEMKSEIDAKSKTDSAGPPKAPFDESRLYSLLQDTINIINALSVQHIDGSSSKPKLLDALERIRKAVDAHATDYKVELHRTSLYRAQCTSALLSDYLAQYPDQLAAAAPTTIKTEPVLKTEAENSSDSENEDAQRVEAERKAALRMSPTAIYAMLCDLKAQEWQYLQNCSSGTAVPPAGSSAALNSVEQAAKKRRTSVTVSDLKFPIALQRRLDGLQAQQSNVEMAADSERAADFARQSAENKVLLDKFNWEVVLDLSVFEGAAAVTGAI